MRCRHCGTEIADKALICFRCGAATTEATYKPPPARRATSVWGRVALFGVVVLALVTLYLGARQPDAGSDVLRWVVIIGLLSIVVFRAILRRRRR